MTATDTGLVVVKTAVDTDALEELLTDSGHEIPCGHSQHKANKEGHHDDGPAVYWCEVKHDCSARPGIKGIVYPVCETYGLYCIHDAYSWWRCAHCQEVTILCQVVVTVGLIGKDG